ncbi:MAG: hydrogenase maturation nickel metallochaperone HypA [Nitrospirae bacterium]|nr:hydrogenase maturation nickel metallochaperone HypA [Nitrospirota bacterium]
MHEFDIVQNLLKLIKKYAEDNHAATVISVKIKLGRLSGVEPYLLKTAFDTFKENTIANCAELIMDIRDVVIRCNQCNQQSILTEFIFICPICGSIDIETIEGDTMTLETLEMK